MWCQEDSAVQFISKWQTGTKQMAKTINTMVLAKVTTAAFKPGAVFMWALMSRTRSSNKLTLSYSWEATWTLLLAQWLKWIFWIKTLLMSVFQDKFSCRVFWIQGWHHTSCIKTCCAFLHGYHRLPLFIVHETPEWSCGLDASASNDIEVSHTWVKFHFILGELSLP